MTKIKIDIESDNIKGTDTAQHIINNMYNFLIMYKQYNITDETGKADDRHYNRVVTVEFENEN